MKIVNLIQGSPKWQEHRARHFNASDAPAMMGCSPYTTRNELLKRMRTGLAAEVDEATQRRFDDGHRFEALARPIAEEIIGHDLYPVVGVDGKLSASFDGLTLMHDDGWEHKSLNDELRAVMTTGCDGSVLPLHNRVQMEQQAMVSGCKRILFMASKWAGETLIEKRHCWYTPDPELRQKIIAGWAQFEADLAAYVPQQAEQPAPAGRAPDTLPALRIQVTGTVTASNLAEFKDHALACFRGINRNLETDQDFADAEKTVKWCGDVEDRLKAAKEHALSQTASIDALFKTIDDIAAEARSTRLELDKLVKARKEQIRDELVAGGVAALRKHIADLNNTIGRPLVPNVPADFAGAIKGKRTLSSLKDAVDTTLANAKIEASEIAGRIQVNLRAIDAEPAYSTLFPDVAQLILKQSDDLAAVIKSRIADHQAAEARRQAEVEARRLAEAQQQEQAAAKAQEVVQQAARPNTVAQQGAPAPKQDTGRTMKLGDINALLSPISISAESLQSIGFMPVATDKNARLYRQSDFPRICAALVNHLNRVCDLQAA